MDIIAAKYSLESQKISHAHCDAVNFTIFSTLWSDEKVIEALIPTQTFGNK